MHKQEGAALLSALFITAIAAIIAVALAMQDRLLINQAQTVRDVNSNYLAMQGIQDWALANLTKYARLSDKQKKEFFMPMVFPKLQYQGRTLTGELLDQQALFNINDLRDPKQQWRFVKLLHVLMPDLPRQQAWQLATAMTDWILSANVNGYYLHLKSPYRSARQPFVNIKELHQVRGMTQSIWQHLQPYITALPVKEAKSLPLNINHVSAVVLQTSEQRLTLNQAQLIVNCVRQHRGFHDAAEFNKLCVQTPLHRPALTGIDTTSQYYILSAKAYTPKDQAQQTSLLEMVETGPKAKAQIVWQYYE